MDNRENREQQHPVAPSDDQLNPSGSSDLTGNEQDSISSTISGNESPAAESSPVDEQTTVHHDADTSAQPVQSEAVTEQPVREAALKAEAEYGWHYAGFWIRFWAFFADVLVVGAVNGIIFSPLFAITGLSIETGWFSLEGVVGTLSFLAYFTLMTKFFGQTLGKMIFGLRVISIKHKSLSWIDVIFREFVGRFIYGSINLLFVPVLYLLYIAVGFTPKKQGLHDYFADTTVIHEQTVRRLTKRAA